MERETIIQMACEAGFWKDLFAYPEFKEHLERFAQLVAADAIAKERESLCQWIVAEFASYERADKIVNAIRARG